MTPIESYEQSGQSDRLQSDIDVSSLLSGGKLQRERVSTENFQSVENAMERLASPEQRRIAASFQFVLSAVGRVGSTVESRLPSATKRAMENTGQVPARQNNFA